MRASVRSLFTTGGIKTKEASLIKFFRSTCSLFISLLNILHKKPVVGDDCSAQGAHNKRFECSGRATARAETCEFIFYRLLHTASVLFKGVKLTQGPDTCSICPS